MGEKVTHLAPDHMCLLGEVTCRQTQLSTANTGLQILVFDMRCCGGGYTARWPGAETGWHNIEFLVNLSRINTLIIGLLEPVHFITLSRHRIHSDTLFFALSAEGYVWNKKSL